MHFKVLRRLQVQCLPNLKKTKSCEFSANSCLLTSSGRSCFWPNMNPSKHTADVPQSGFLFRTHKPLCWGQRASCRITKVRLHTVTKAWVNFNSASDESRTFETGRQPEEELDRSGIWVYSGENTLCSQSCLLSVHGVSIATDMKGFTDLVHSPSARTPKEMLLCAPTKKMSYLSVCN